MTSCNGPESAQTQFKPHCVGVRSTIHGRRLINKLMQMSTVSRRMEAKRLMMKKVESKFSCSRASCTDSPFEVLDFERCPNSCLCDGQRTLSLLIPFEGRDFED